MESYKALLSSDGEDNEPSPMGMNANTLQQSYLNKELRKRMSNADLISDDINQVISNIVYTIFGIISDKLTSEVNNLLRSKGSSFWDNVTEITMLGGITVAPLGRNNFGQYFKPIIFQSMTMEGWVDIMYMYQDAMSSALGAFFWCILILFWEWHL